LEYLTDAEVKIFCKEVELPLDEDTDTLDQVKIDATIPLVRYDIDMYLTAGGYATPLDTQENIDEIKMISIPVFKYHITNNSGARTETILEDYKLAIGKLTKISEGKLILTLPSKNNPDKDVSGGLQTLTLDF
jgi:phage gp36-like protein